MAEQFPDHWYMVHAAEHPLELRYLDESKVSSEINGLIKASVGAAKKLQAEIERLRAERAWRPIETAPKDGTEIWGWNGHDMETIIWAGDPPGWLSTLTDNQFWQPTHWQSLPEPPAT